MAKYYVTHSCGHEEVVQLYGKESSRRWMIEKMESEPCKDCIHKEALEMLKKQAEENDLPELEGSQKQIEWAMSIRQQFLDIIEDLSEAMNKEMDKSIEANPDKADKYEKIRTEYTEKFNKSTMYISEQTKAKFFIDDRDEFGKCIPDTTLKTVAAYADAYDKEHDPFEIEAKEEVKRKQVEVHPEEVIGTTNITLTAEDGCVHLYSGYEKRLVDIIHGLDFKMTWTGKSWEYNLYNICGSAEAVIAELGNKLLEEGYIVIFPDAATADMASSGNFEKYNLNAVFGNKKDDKVLNVKFNRNDSKMENMLINIRGAKRIKGYDDTIKIPVSHYKEVLEIAEENGFVFSPAALKCIEKYKASFITATPAHVERDTAKAPGRKDVDLSDLNDD